MPRMSHQDARDVLYEAYAVREQPIETLAEVQCVQAISLLECQYGNAFGGSNNWGCIQCGQKPPCPPSCVEHGDSHADGSKYQACFRVYPTPLAGALDLLHELYRRPGVPEALRSGDTLAVAEAMRASGYFEAPAKKYALGIETRAKEIAGALHEPWNVQVPSRRWGVAALIAAGAGAVAVAARRAA